ncbi:MAG TPA: amidohydrolase family protein [Thermomicrobiaceae bacterium]|nr:amidohydrolase family protein [Thermomicrobiaceae bacterium]
MTGTSEGGRPTTVIAGRFIDGTTAEPRRGARLTLDGGRIIAVEPATGPAGDGALDLSEYTVLPGLINMHAHTILPGDGTDFGAWMELPDELLLLQAQANGLAALRSGVTTIRDCGGKGTLMFRLRDAIRAGITEGPRFVLSGRPLTITGGHCRYFGGEVDGVDGMRLAARQLLKEGADFIKIMASGGGTPGTYSQFPAFDVAEMRAAIDEAHKIGRRAACHCIATQSITNALDAGTDHIEHCSFMAPDTTWQYDGALARRVADSGVYVTATLQVMADAFDVTLDRYRRGVATPEEAAIVARSPNRTADNVANIRFLHELGVPIVAGNDAGWRHTGFDDFYQELQYLHQAGLSTLEAIHAATGRAAEACQLGDQIGTLAPGHAADLIAVGGDPSEDLGALRDPALVMLGGRVVVDRR